MEEYIIQIQSADLKWWLNSALMLMLLLSSLSTSSWSSRHRSPVPCSANSSPGSEQVHSSTDNQTWYCFPQNVAAEKLGPTIVIRPLGRIISLGGPEVETKKCFVFPFLRSSGAVKAKRRCSSAWAEKGNTKHLLVSTSEFNAIRACVVNVYKY